MTVHQFEKCHYRTYLDELDLQIIGYIERSGKVNIATVAKAVDAPHAKVSRRLYALRDRGIVRIEIISACLSLVELVKRGCNSHCDNPCDMRPRDRRDEA